MLLPCQGLVRMLLPFQRFVRTLPPLQGFGRKLSLFHGLAMTLLSFQGFVKKLLPCQGFVRLPPPFHRLTTMLPPIQELVKRLLLCQGLTRLPLFCTRARKANATIPRPCEGATAPISPACEAAVANPVVCEDAAIHCGRYSKNPKGTIPPKPHTVGFYPRLWTELLETAKAKSISLSF